MMVDFEVGFGEQEGATRQLLEHTAGKKKAAAAEPAYKRRHA